VLASVVIKIEYRRTLHQGSAGILRQPSFPSVPATKILSASSLPAAFLPGSGKYVECDVTPSKQTTATFLPGATTALRRLRQDTASCPELRRVYPELRGAAVPSLVSSIQFHGSLRTGRHGFCVNPDGIHPERICEGRALACTHDPAAATVDFRPFLTGSASRTELAVTHSKQTTAPFLTGARTAIKQFRFPLNFSAQSSAQAAESATPSRRHGRS
jgi:hypothetical protein